MRGGIAERGGVRVGHRIIEINGQSVVATAHEKIVQALSNSVGEVRLSDPTPVIFLRPSWRLGHRASGPSSPGPVSNPRGGVRCPKATGPAEETLPSQECLPRCALTHVSAGWRARPLTSELPRPEGLSLS